MFAIFQLAGTCPNDIDLLKRRVSGLISMFPIVFSSLGEISSGRLGLEVFSACIWSLTSCSVMKILLREKFGRVSSGKGGGFSILEIFAKCLFRVCALSRGCMSNESLFFRGGGGFCLFFRLEILPIFQA